MSIWSNLRRAKGADALASQRDNLVGLIGSHEVELARLRETLRTGAFDDASFDPKALGTQIRESEDELSALRGAMEGVDRALAAAKAAEAAAALEAVHADAIKAQRELRDTQVAAHVALSKLASVLGKERDARDRLAALNSKLSAAGRDVPAPLTMLSQLDRAAWEEWRARDHSAPVNAPYLANPLQGIDLLHYFGPRAGSGPESSPLARLVELKI